MDTFIGRDSDHRVHSHGVARRSDDNGERGGPGGDCDRIDERDSLHLHCRRNQCHGNRSGIAAVGVLRDLVHTRRPASALGRDTEIFAALAKMLASGVTVWRLTLPDDPACLGDAAAKVLHVLEEQR